MDALTPARPALSALPRRRTPSPARAGLPDSRTRPSDPSVSNHLRTLRLVRARYPSTDRTEIASPRVFSQRELGASPLASRLATSHRPNRVSYRTDWPFTSCCSPPRVATTQLQSVTSYVDLERTFTSPTRCALRRTAMGVPPMHWARPRWPWHDGRNISFCSLWTRHWRADAL